MTLGTWRGRHTEGQEWLEDAVAEAEGGAAAARSILHFLPSRVVGGYVAGFAIGDAGISSTHADAEPLKDREEEC